MFRLLFLVVASVVHNISIYRILHVCCCPMAPPKLSDLSVYDQMSAAYALD